MELRDYNINTELTNQNKYLKKFNSMMYGLISLVFLTILLTFLSTYFEFRSHLCKYSNVKKCLAADKKCPHSGSVTSTQDVTFEVLSTQPLIIKKDLANVVNQQLSIIHPSEESEIGTCIFSMDFNFTDSVPLGGDSDILGLGPSVGYINFTNNDGVSIYLYPFVQNNLPGSSIQQIEHVISKAMENSNKVIYLDEPFESQKNTTTVNFGVTYIKDNDNTFQLGGYVKDGNVQIQSTNNYEITSTETGTSALFSNFNKIDSVPMQQTTSSDSSIDITGQIITNNYRNSVGCNDTVKDGCACVDPVVTNIPNCNDYNYNKNTHVYDIKNTSKSPGKDATVRFCSYYSPPASNQGQGIQINQPPSYNSVIKDVRGYYFNGYSPSKKSNNPEDKDDRYTLDSIFCSSIGNLTNDKQTNNLYEPKNTNKSKYTDLSTAYDSSQPNGRINPDGSVNLGHF